jgi:hypothetical protein
MASAAAVEEDNRIAAMLTERGINGVGTLMAELEETPRDSLLGTIKWWDDLPQGRKGTGLLITKLRDGGVIGYRRPHERTDVEGELVVTPERLATLRAICLTPDGLTRIEAYDFCEKLARKANTTTDAIIDTVMGPDWKATPPHPAHVIDTMRRFDAAIRYDVWMHRYFMRDIPDEPQLEVQREANESVLDWSKRFWKWKDPKDMAEKRVAREIAAKARVSLRVVEDTVEKLRGDPPEEPLAAETPAPPQPVEEPPAPENPEGPEAPPQPQGGLIDELEATLPELDERPPLEEAPPLEPAIEEEGEPW